MSAPSCGENLLYVQLICFAWFELSMHLRNEVKC